MKNKNSLGCGIGFKLFNGKCVRTEKKIDFICGVANAWGEERFCKECITKLRKKWKEKDEKQPRAKEIKYLKSVGL